MKNTSTALLVLVAASSVMAQAPCKFRPDECEVFDRYRAEQAAKARRQAEATAAANRAYEEQKAQERMQHEADLAAAAEARARQDAEIEARRKAYEEQSAAEDRAQAEADRKALRAEAARKAKCGSDYRNIQVGMTVPRVLECVSSSFKPAGQANTKQGVVTTYRAPNGFFHAIDGRVVQWGRF